MRICPWRPHLALNALLFGLLLASLVPVSAGPTVAAAQTLSVDGSDPAATDTTCAPCKTIQGALILAGPGASITVAPGTYHETLTITQSVSLIGGVARLPGEQGPTIVDGGGTGSVVTIPNVVPPNVLVSLTGLTLTDGVAPQGGGIEAPGGTLSLSGTTIMSNTATSYGGGGIYASHTVMLTDSPVMNNTGGGIYASTTVMLTGSPVMSNTATYGGGGIEAYGAVTLTHSPVMNNTVKSGSGGGIHTSTFPMSPPTALTLTDSPVMSNTAGSGGGIFSSCCGPVTLTDSPVMSNTATQEGGGIYGVGPVTLTRSPVVSNTAGSGGGILITDSGSLSIINSTLSGNSATASGGAIASGGNLAVSFSTVSANSAGSGGGIAATGGTTTLNASILAGNMAPSGPDCAGAVTSLGDNLVGNADGCSGVSAAGDHTGSTASPLDPRLGPLADNGGPTWTMAPQPGSPALDAVPIAKCSVSTDQRGQPRPDPLYPGACDSGAVEVPAAAPPTSTPTRTPSATTRPTPTSAARSAPRLALVPTSAHVGDRVIISGSGFGPNELLTLALNGEALTTTTLRTSGQGRFTATVTAPDGLLPGANTLSAVGATSGRVALTTVRGRRSTQTYYLAGGVESRTEHTALDLLNTSAQGAHVGYTLYSQSGDTSRGTLTVGAHAARVVPVASLTSLRGSVGLALRTDRPLAAQLSLRRQGRDGDTILATPGTARRWYLAAGETARTFHESLALLNPDRTRPVQVRLHLLPSGGGRSRTVTVRVRPHTHLVEDINRLLPRQSLSIIAEASGPVVVERRLTFSRDGHGHDYGLTTRLGTTAPADVWLLAQGTPLPHGETSLTLLNATTRTAHVTVRFYGSSGRLVGSRTIRLKGARRAQLALPSTGPAAGAAGVLTSDQPLVVERSEYGGAPNGTRTTGGAVFGRNGVAPRWSFPGGDMRRGQREVLLLANPSAATVHVVATRYGSDGRTAQQHVTLPPHGQSTLDVGRSFPAATGTHGVSVTSANGDGFLAEQAVFAANGSTVQRTQGLAQ